MRRTAVYFDGAGRVSLREEAVEPLSQDNVLVQTLVSAVSAGTELLFVRGLVPSGMTADASLPALRKKVSYPLKYGYAVVGRVIDVGRGVDATLRGRLVFAFHPHESIFTALPGELLPLPSLLSPDDAVLLPFVETAVNFVMDGAPLIGEKVVVLGQGMVGLLTTALLARFPLGSLVTADRFRRRCERSVEMGAHRSFLLADEAELRAFRGHFDGEKADAVYELSGNPSALNEAVEVCGFDGRVVIGSWYGEKSAPLSFGGRFHRSRIRLVSSQVSTVAPALSGRWTKERRWRTALDMAVRLRPSRLISHRFPVAAAPEAYRRLLEEPEAMVQTVFTYP